MDKPAKPNDKPSQDAGRKPGPHGEGNYEATRRYNEGVKDHMRDHDVEREARDAAPRNAAEQREMTEAERQGASRAKEEDPALRKRSGK